MHKEKTGHAIAVNSRESKVLPICHKNQPDQQIAIYQQKKYRAGKAEFLTYGTENKVGVLFRYVFQFGLRAVQIALAPKTARSYGNLGLIDVIAHPRRIVHGAQ